MRGSSRPRREQPVRQGGEARLATLVAGGVIGAVLATLVGAAVCPTSIGPLAYAAIVVVGSIGGSALGVLAVAVRRSR